MTDAALSSAGDPFGLRSLDIDELRAKRGAKWQFRPAAYSAWVADMDFPVAPAITDALREVVDRNEFGYPAWGAPGDVSPAATLFAPRMAERFGWDPDPTRVHDLVDVIQGVRATVHHLSEPGDGVVLHLPSYHPFLHTIDEMDRRLVPVEWRDGAFDYDTLDAELAASGAAVWIVCHPHNPLGHVMRRPELERIAEIAERHDVVLISDEIHADLTMPGHDHVPLALLGEDVAARTVTVTSASKAFNLAGLRWAVMHAGSDRMHEAMTSLPGHYLGAPNLMAVVATVAAWTEGGAWLDAVLGVLDENRLALPGMLAEHVPGAVCKVPDATYLAWVDCRALDLGGNPAKVFRERGVELSPGSQFGPPGEGHVRINIATSPAVLAATVAAMAG
ncbi:MAG: aminotransferase class I/II-fold pyridoxal phosphate-dependent enzyme [Ilumatobacter sp.]|uniref:MalY/PatB family protein n=1 Tax=Ilumatobacter sp. TaxID=1967498 RepID=UPI00260C4915|nr:aminotransferase class I/II-fold pyridoxal phosphate-dependent enzyme [Ilumatobacter sp.]MDJ0768244.1 aminotransferase class I/II-fold pyridoxal phosphate-dependent enzyme [Ilumatobacter sp.]